MGCSRRKSVNPWRQGESKSRRGSPFRPASAQPAVRPETCWLGPPPQRADDSVPSRPRSASAEHLPEHFDTATACWYALAVKCYSSLIRLIRAGLSALVMIGGALGQ